MRSISIRLTAVVAVVIVLAACASTPPTEPQSWAGHWMDMGSRIVFTFEAVNGRMRVVRAYSEDQQIYPVMSSGWREGVFTWRIEVPDTGYEITYEVTDAEEGVLKTRWHNQYEQGVETLVRIDEE